MFYIEFGWTRLILFCNAFLSKIFFQKFMCDWLKLFWWQFNGYAKIDKSVSMRSAKNDLWVTFAEKTSLSCSWLCVQASIKSTNITVASRVHLRATICYIKFDICCMNVHIWYQIRFDHQEILLLEILLLEFNLTDNATLNHQTGVRSKITKLLFKLYSFLQLLITINRW